VVVSDDLSALWVHELPVERRTASGGGYGDQYAAAETVSGFYDDTTQLMPGPDGVQVVVSGRFAFPSSVAYIPVGSRVTLPALFGGRVTEVIASAVGDAGGQPVPAHQEVGLR